MTFVNLGSRKRSERPFAPESKVIRQRAIHQTGTDEFVLVANVMDMFILTESICLFLLM